jgi:hypothetical protein
VGFNTTVLILNDGLDHIEKHPDEFYQGLCEKMHDGGDVSLGGFVNPVHVMPTAHADVFRLYATHGNAILELSRYNKETMRLVTEGKDFQKRYVLDMIASAERELDDLREQIEKIEDEDD